MNEKLKKYNHISLRANRELILLFEKAIRMQGLSSYSKVIERASYYVLRNKENLILNINEAEHFDNFTIDEINIPPNIKLRIYNDELNDKINELIRKKYSISKIKSPFKIKFLLVNYLHLTKLDKEENIETINELKLSVISLLLGINNLELINKIITIIREEGEKNV